MNSEKKLNHTPLDQPVLNPIPAGVLENHDILGGHFDPSPL